MVQREAIIWQPGPASEFRYHTCVRPGKFHKVALRMYGISRNISFSWIKDPCSFLPLKSIWYLNILAGWWISTIKRATSFYHLAFHHISSPCSRVIKRAIISSCPKSFSHHCKPHIGSLKWKFLDSLETRLYHVILFWKLSYERMFLLKQTCGIFLEAA